MKRQRLLVLAVLVLLWHGPLCSAQERAEPSETTPVFLYDDGWFEEQEYRCWDAPARWQAVAADLKPHTWLTFYMAPEMMYHVKDDPTGAAGLVRPYPDPEYPRKHAAMVSALEFCQREKISAVLMVRRYRKLREAAPNYAAVESLLKRYDCVRGLLFAELGGWQFSEVDQEHLRGFGDLAKRYGRKIIWALQVARGAALWNRLMADPQWLAFLNDHRDVIVPTWKTVEPYENMLNWSDCVGLWLSGTTADWGFQFDAWYWSTSYPASQGNYNRAFWGQTYLGTHPSQASGHRSGPAIMSAPPCLVKDTMILAALSGAKYFTTERLAAFCPFDGGGSLRSVREKTQRLILRRGLCQPKDRVATLVKAAALNPASDAEMADSGYFASYHPQRNPRPNKNVLWKTVFGIEHPGLDIVPNEGRHFVVPVVPAAHPWYKPAAPPRLLTPAEVAGGTLERVLNKPGAPRLAAGDPHVLVFDAGRFVYLTDSREEDRTTLVFTLHSTGADEYRSTYLAEDATPVEIEPVTERTDGGGWTKKFIIFAGCSLLLERQGR